MRYFLVAALSCALLLLGSSSAFAAAPDHVFGNGTSHIVGPGSFTDVTILVDAADRTPGSGLDAQGTLTVSDRPSNGVGEDLQAEALCVNATNNRGVVVGRVTSSSPDNVNGRTIFVRITDNGKGKPGEPPDTTAFALSELTPEQGIAAGFCATNFVDQFPVTNGNFTVQDKS